MAFLKRRTKFHGASIARAKVMRADGRVEYHYSKPQVPWWNIKARLWVRRRMKVMKQEEENG